MRVRWRVAAHSSKRSFACQNSEGIAKSDHIAIVPIGSLGGAFIQMFLFGETRRSNLHQPFLDSLCAFDER